MAYASTTLTPVQKRYSQFEKETLACTWSIQHFHNYIFGYTFIRHCDNLSLLKNFKNARQPPKARVERLLLRIQSYSFEVEHEKGTSNPADYLSRHPQENIDSKPEHGKIEQYVNLCIKNALPKAITLVEVQEATKKDPTFQILIDVLTNKNPKYWKLPELSPFAKLIYDFVYSNEVVLRDHKIVLPASLQ